MTLVLFYMDKMCLVLEHCRVTFCFSFDVLIQLNPIQVNIEGGGPS